MSGCLNPLHPFLPAHGFLSSLVLGSLFSPEFPMAWVQNIKPALSCHSLPTRMWETGRTLPLDPMVDDLTLGQLNVTFPAFPEADPRRCQAQSLELRPEDPGSPFSRTKSAYAFE